MVKWTTSGFPAIELEPIDGDNWRFYNISPLGPDGHKLWHDDNELTLPHNLPDESEPPFDVPSWLLWNLENKGVIAPSNFEPRLGSSWPSEWIATA